MNVFFYLREFPLDSEVPFTGPMKAIHGMASVLGTYDNISVTVLCESSGDCEVSRSTYRIRSFLNRHRSIPFYLGAGLKSFIREQSQDDTLFILNGNFNPCLYSVSRLLTANSIPYVAASHSAYHPAVFRLNPLKKWVYWYLFERSLLNRSAAVQVLDERQSEQLQRLNVRQPIIEVLNGFSRKEMLPENTLSWNETDEPRIMYFGRLDAYTKGLDLLLQAFGRVQTLDPGSLMFKGPDNGDDRQELQNLSHALGVSGKVAFDGPEYDVLAPAVMKDSDIICLPSRYEGFGLTALEAMLAGRVLLVSENAGIAPHVEASGCGVVVRPDVDSIQKGLQCLLERRAEWKEMGLSGRQYAMTNLSWESIADRAVHQYTGLLSLEKEPEELETDPAGYHFPRAS